MGLAARTGAAAQRSRAQPFGAAHSSQSATLDRMLAAIRSASVLGIDASDVCVEVDVAQGLPHWTIVGLPAGEVKESRERVTAALANSGFTVPPRRVTVSLSPGDTRKAGTGFDLPIAVGLLVALGAIRVA